MGRRIIIHSSGGKVHTVYSEEFPSNCSHPQSRMSPHQGSVNTTVIDAVNLGYNRWRDVPSLERRGFEDILNPFDIFGIHK